MQLMLSQCPGFESCDAPASEQSKGNVVVQPGQVIQALAWLKRRFRASENIELSDGGGIVIEVAPRQRSVPSSKGKRVKIVFGKVEQFTLAL